MRLVTPIRKSTTWLGWNPDDGLWLNRLLELTRPTPAQVVVIGLGVLRGLRTVHAAGAAHGSVFAGEVHVGIDGQVRLDGGATRARCPVPLGQPQRADLAAVGVLLAHLARAARRSPTCANASTPVLLAALDTAADQAARPGADIDLVMAPLEAACGPDKEAAARSELAALARAATVRRSVSSSEAALQTPQPAPPAAASASRTRPRAARLGAWLRGLWKRTWTWVVALMVLVAAVALEFALLHERLAEDLHLLRGAAERPGERTASPVELPPVPRPAPASAGVVGGLDLRAFGPCTPGAVCAVRVLVQLQPQPQRQPQRPPHPPRAVTWTFQVIDRCTGSQRSLPGGVVSVAPGAAQVQAVSQVSLPPGGALAVIAVTSEPARAASGPMLVPARQGACPSS